MYRTSEICQHSDHKIIELTKAKIGVNLPPLHPWCRSTTIPVIEGLEGYVTERRARDNHGNNVVTGNINYEQYTQLLSGIPVFSTQKLPSGLTIKVYQNGWNSAGGSVELTEDEEAFYIAITALGIDIAWIPRGKIFIDEDGTGKQLATNDFIAISTNLEWELKTPQHKIKYSTLKRHIKSASGQGKRNIFINYRGGVLEVGSKEFNQLATYNIKNPLNKVDRIFILDKEGVKEILNEIDKK